MKTLIPALLIFVLTLACKAPASRTVVDPGPPGAADTLRIANEELEYEVIIIDPGFNTWLTMNARPRNFYSQQYMEVRNISWVQGWNSKFREGGRRNLDLFSMPIDYQAGIDYGYEVNYLLFNYLTYFQIRNNVRLGGFVPRI